MHTCIGIKDSNFWEISKEKSKLQIGNVHIRKAKFSKGKCTHWKSKMRNFKVGNENYPSWKLVMRKLKIGNWKY